MIRIVRVMECMDKVLLIYGVNKVIFLSFFSLCLLHVHTKGRQGLTNGLRAALIGYLDRLLFTGGI